MHARGIIPNVGPKSVLLDRTCPKWKENVPFALKQDDSQVIEEAMANVCQLSQCKPVMKQEILTVSERQNAALEVFELAMEASSKQPILKIDGVDGKEPGGFLSQQEGVYDLAMVDDVECE
jgi:hypothetical protein